ncbi:NAD(P)/FAD-dependent oxidoreductase [Streptomyces sp. WAC05374]|uniref:NAD(P)/FAD-dependent oxidoreductase n=1 Tax=Streptomyces sp. WAC05374 TaxID=2487420 RepID=UPI002286951A|nr:NAD(P)/FAD-dependent oxidoreductase [Streptomyces sp. WAC05374]
MFDVAIVGARCAGATTAMLLARHGYRVLMLERAEFPRDTLSTLLIHLRGMELLARWGLLKDVLATGCPPLTELSFSAPGIRVEGSVPAEGDARMVCAPRRYALDEVLARAAVRAGAEFRPGVSVTGLHREDGAVAGVTCRAAGGRMTVERARLVIGADGRHSTVARLVGAPYTRWDGRLTRAWYTYWSGVEGASLRLFLGAGLGGAAIPTHDGLTLINVQLPVGHPTGERAERDRLYLDLLARASPELRDAVAAGARREDRLYCCGDLPNFFRRPYGEGWALVGDAVLHKDPMGAQGIADSFEQAALLGTCLGDALGDRERSAAALGRYAAALESRFAAPYEENLLHARLAESEQVMAGLRAVQDDPRFREAFLRTLSGATEKQNEVPRMA